MANNSVNWYQPGDLIYCGKPFVYVLDQTHRNQKCENCLVMSPFLKKCQACLCVMYCSKKCQKENWSDHKLDCKFLPKLPEHIHSYYIQLFGRFLLKIKGRPWETIQERVGDQNVSFAELPWVDKQMKDEIFVLYCKDMDLALKSYIGVENVPPFQELLEIMRKVRPSIFTDGTVSIFLGASLFPVCCIPNANVTRNGKEVKIRALKTIPKEDLRKITVNDYLVPVSNGVVEGNLGDIKLNCNCTECSLPYGVSVLTKIIDESKAFRIIKETDGILRTLVPVALLKVNLAYRAKVDDLVKRQKGILGNTNILRLKLMAMKYMYLDDPNQATIDGLEELLNYLKLAFGDFSQEHQPIYMQLITLNELLGHHVKATEWATELLRMIKAVQQ